MSRRARIRLFKPDDAAALTDLVHRAFADLARRGLNFTAADQPLSTTLSRASSGRTWLADLDGDLLASLTITMPPSSAAQELSVEARRPHRAWLNQLAVDPRVQGRGLASRLFAIGRTWARDQGATHLGLDTAMTAHHLVTLYEHWGFAPVEKIRWPGKNYESVVMTLLLPRR